MKLISSAFKEGETIPKKYTQHGQNINPPLEFIDVPADVKSLVLVMDDPDVPPQAGVPVWDHWVVYNIPPTQTMIPESVANVGVSGKHTRGGMGYSGPKPPDREHRYFFKLFALDTTLDLLEGATKDEVLAMIDGHIIASAELVGRCAPLVD